KIPAFTPVLLNLSFIAASLWVAPHVSQPIYVMAGAVMVGGLAQMLIQIPALIKIGMLPRLTFTPLSSLAYPGVRRVLQKMGPALFAVSVAQISLMINTSIASHLVKGSISALTYADRLMEFPTALLGVALGTILLPSLSKASVDGDKQEYSALLDWGLRLNFLLALPAAIGLAVLAEPLISTLFHYGKFDAHAVQMAKQPLIAYSVGLIGIILVKTLAPAFYARQDIRTPVKIAIGVLCATQLMNLVFVPYFQVAGLALSIGMGACLNAGLLYIGLRTRNIYQPCGGWLFFYCKLIGALCILAATTSVTADAFNWIELGQRHASLRALALLAVVSAGAASYFTALWLMGFRLNDLKRRTK
ncbi:MAG: murein biosynthesis integral rane protein MurJ, partial [Pseudomonadota bacterium]